MIKMRVVWMTAVLLCVAISTEDIEGDLKLVFAVFRHGDRSPIEIYPKDKYQADKWPMGLGELTEIGKRNAYDLGVFIRHRYMQKLNLDNKFKTNSPEFYLRSTGINRAKMSAVYFLAGFYDEDFQTVVKEADKFRIKYNVRFEPEDNDQLLSIAPCPKADKLLEEWKQSKECKDFLQDNQNVLDLMKNTGWSNPDRMEDIADDIYCEMSHNLTQPDWVTQNLKSIMQYWDNSRKFRSPTAKLLEVNTGPLMTKLVETIDDKIHKESKRKMVIFSAHDSNIINLLLGLESFNNRQPPYSSAVIVELYQKQKMFYVNLLYHNDSKTEPYHLTIPGCKQNEPCSSRLLRKTAKKTKFSANEREVFCGSSSSVFKSHSMNITDNIIPVSVVIVIAVCAVLSIIMYRIYRRRRRPVGDPMMYRPLAYGDDDEDV